MSNFHYYRGYRFQILEEFESPEESEKRRLATGDWRSRVIGYRPGRIFVKRGNGWKGLKMIDWPVFGDRQNAIDNVEAGIDELLGSLSS